MQGSSSEKRLPVAVEAYTTVDDVGGALLTHPTVKPVFADAVKGLCNDHSGGISFDITLNKDRTGGKQLVFHFALTNALLSGDADHMKELSTAALDEAGGDSLLVAKVIYSKDGLVNESTLEEMDRLYNDQKLGFTGLIILASPRVDTHIAGDKRRTSEISNEINLLIIKGAPTSTQWQIVDQDHSAARQEDKLTASGLEIKRVTIGNN